MRDIKFRAWDDIKKKWLYAKPNVSFGSISYNPNTVSQYTGLKDKNGVEIYEGDIIASWTWDGKETDETAMYVVEWFDKNEDDFSEVGASSNYPNLAPAVGLGFRLLKGYFDHRDLKLCYFFERFEVIGNIYENPELLEAEL